MGWWSHALRTRSEGWTFGALEADQVPDSLRHEQVEPESGYLSGFLRSMWVTDVRRGTARLYGTVQCHTSLPHLLGGRAEFQVVVAPPDLRDIDPSDANRLVTRNIRLFGPVPYRGGDLEVELGLFSVKSGDLVGPFVDLLETMTGAAGVSLIHAARPFADPVRRGFDLLMGTEGDSALEIGFATAFARPETGYFVIMRKPADDVDLMTIAIRSDYRVVDGNGNPFLDFPYAVVAIEMSPRRDDWFQVPELAATYAALRDDVAKGRLDTVKESLAIFKRTALLSPDLLVRDATALVEKVGAEIDQTLQLTQTSGGPESMPALEEIDLYA